jgi:hypothetical protein
MTGILSTARKAAASTILAQPPFILAKLAEVNKPALKMATTAESNFILEPKRCCAALHDRAVHHRNP